MSYAGYATPLRVELRASRTLAAALTVVHGGAAALIWTLPWSWWWCAPATALVAAAGLRAGAAHLWGRRAIVAFLWGADGGWVLYRRDGTRRECTLLPGSYLQPRLAVLRFVDKGDRPRFLRFSENGVCPLFPSRSLVLLPDAIDADQFRRLRVRLMLEGADPPTAVTSRRRG